jgi:hypothetical protein
VNRAEDVWALGKPALWELLRTGHPLDPAALDDAVFRGTSLGMPGWVDRLAWKTFRKVFHRDAGRGVRRGWNVRLEQDGLRAPSRPMRRRDGSELSFGQFEVVPAAGRRAPGGLGQSLLLDYGRGGNPPWDVTRCLRDPLVALAPGRTDLLLGWSYLELGPLRVRTPSFFTLEREGTLDTPVPRPRG